MSPNYVIRRTDTGWYLYSYNTGPRYGYTYDINRSRLFKYGDAQALRDRGAQDSDGNLIGLEIIPVTITIEVQKYE